MLIIKFHFTRPEQNEFRDDNGLFAVNSEGFIVQKAVDRILPPPEAFENAVKLLGIATLKEKKLLYTFDQITPELIAGGIAGLSANASYMPIYTIIVNDLGDKIAWSRGIESIYFSDY